MKLRGILLVAVIGVASCSDQDSDSGEGNDAGEEGTLATDTSATNSSENGENSESQDGNNSEDSSGDTSEQSEQANDDNNGNDSDDDGEDNDDSNLGDEGTDNDGEIDGDTEDELETGDDSDGEDTQESHTAVDSSGATDDDVNGTDGEDTQTNETDSHSTGGEDTDTSVVEGGCEYNGQTYAVGESFDAADGCNTCSCGENQMVMCTKMACPDTGANTGDDTETCEGTVVDSSMQCLMDDAFCYEMSNGKWCTGPQASQCPEGYRRLESNESCPGGDSPLCYMYSEGTYCKLDRSYTIDECENAGGDPRYDPGDGSLITQGCPNNETTLAYLDSAAIEGGLCCKSN